MKIKTVSELLLLTKQKGIYNGKLVLPIVNGSLRLDKVEFQILEWEELRKNVDGIVDNF